MKREVICESCEDARGEFEDAEGESSRMAFGKLIRPCVCDGCSKPLEIGDEAAAWTYWVVPPSGAVPGPWEREFFNSYVHIDRDDGKYPIQANIRTELHDKIHGGLSCSEVCPIYELIDAAALAGRADAVREISDSIAERLAEHEAEISRVLRQRGGS